MTTSGTVVYVQAKPRAFVVQPPGNPPPAPVSFTDGIGDDEWDVAVAAYGSGNPVTVTGTPPTVDSISSP